MFGFWPRPFEDELLYSVLARLRLMLGMPSSQHLLRMAFGHSRRPKIDANLPTGLDSFSDRFPGGFPGGPDAIIDRHTALPYLARFMSPVMYDYVRHTMRTQRRPQNLTRWVLKDKARLWRENSPLWDDGLAFCPSCVVADLDAYGLPGYRRVHQMPGVFVCPWHGTALRRSGGNKGANHELIPCPLEPETGLEVSNPLDAATSTWLSEGSRWLLDDQSFRPRIDRVRRVMGGLLFSRDWVDATGKVTRGFKDECRERFGWKCLPFIDPVHLTGRGIADTVLGSSSGSRSVPVCFLIVLMMLDLTPEDFFRLCRAEQAVEAPGP